MSHDIDVAFIDTKKTLIHCFIVDGKVPADLEAVNKEQGWNEFIRQMLIRLHQNQVRKR